MKLRADGQGRLNVEPSPAQAGGKVTITFSGDGPVYVSVDGQSGTKKVDLDENGQATIDVPAGAGGAFSVTDFKVPDSATVSVEVVGT